MLDAPVLALALALLADPLPGPPPLPEPVPIPREQRLERGRPPNYFLSQRQQPRFGGRVGLGVAGFLGPPVPVRAGFALDLLAVGRVSASRRHPVFSLFPELGYSLAAGPQQTSQHLASVGFGLGGTVEAVGVALIPRFVGGSLLGRAALGVRSGLLVEVVDTGGFGLELSHQALALGRDWSHAIVATLVVGFYWPEAR